ncbi:citron rho-interacting kinase-like isoform X1 [Octopus vulgaris]|uniref:non-specific serine/threonine protein kinase n=1 Tax=Octopus vulgaris TaxID=6645 RepID=A0AA36EX51_OCTVU|nr:citron rho-interacting kinase-like isoform X1 [Octopus vulgaris]
MEEFAFFLLCLGCGSGKAAAMMFLEGSPAAAVHTNNCNSFVDQFHDIYAKGVGEGGENEIKMDNESMDSITSRIQKLEKLMQGEIQEAGILDTLVNHQGLLDCLYVLFNECQTQNLLKNKYVYEFVKKYKKTVQEIAKLRLKATDFEVKEIIGRGHFGEVRVVRERYSGTVHAMKMLEKSKTLAQSDVSFFSEEKEIMAKADSCWITKLHYTFQDANYLYFVMEFYPGGDLLSLLSRYNDIFDEKMARFYLTEMVLAINAVHSLGYIHRDIKPENVLLDRNGHIRLADFGSAAKMSSKNLVSSHIPVGTPDYVAPELLKMNTASSVQRYSVEVDWWSLGVCGYEMLYGVTPFSSSDNTKSGTYNKIMNYQHYLKFPSSEISKDAVDLLQHLLTEAKYRLNYQSLLVHPFFASMNWQNIRNEKSPFIPSVSSLDDTSNFDEYERLPPQPKYDDPKLRRDFSGKDLPFVGFSYFGSTKDESTDSSGVTSGVTSSEFDESSDDGKPSNVKLTLTVNVKEHQKIAERCNELESNESLLRAELEELRHVVDRKELTIQRLQEDKLSLTKDLSNCADKSNVLAKRLEQEIEAKDRVHKQGLSILNDINKFNSEAEDIKCAITHAKLDELKQVIKVLEGQNSAMVKQLFNKDRTLIECQKHLLSTQEQLEKAKDRLEKDLNHQNAKTSKCHICHDGKLLNKAEKLAEDMSKKYEDENKLRIHLEKKLDEQLKKQMASDKWLSDSTESLKDELAENQKTIAHQDKLIKELLEKADNQEMTWKRISEDLELKIKVLEDESNKLKTKEKSNAELKLSLLQQVNTYQEEVKQLRNQLQAVTDKITRDEESVTLVLENKIEELRKQLEKKSNEKELSDEREKQHLRKIKELENILDDKENLKANNEQRLLTKIKELENQLDQENVDNKLLESKEQRLLEELKTLGTELDHANAGRKMVESKEQQLIDKIKNLENQLESVESGKRTLENKEQRLTDKIKAYEHDLEQEKIGRKLAENKEKCLQESVKSLENKLDDITSSKKQFENKDRRNLEKIKQLETQLEKESSDRKLAENKDRRNQERIRDLENQLEKESSCKSSLENKERRLLDKVKGLESQVSNDEMTKHQLENRVAQLQERIKDLEQQMDKKDKQADATEKQLEEKIKLLKDEVRSYSSKEKLGESHEKHLKSRIEELEQKLELETIEKQRLDRKCRQLTRQIEDTERNSEKFNSEKNEMKKIERLHKERIKELEAEVQNKTKAKVSLPLSRSVSVNRMQGRSAETNEKTEEKIQILQQDKAHLEARVSTLEHIVEEYQSNITALKENIKKQDKSNKELVKSLTEELTSWEEEASKMKERLLLQIDKIKTQRDKAEDRLQSSQSDLEKWQQEITKSEENLVDYHRQVKVLQKELEETHRSWSQTQWELDKIKREHDKLEHAYMEISKKLADNNIDQESVSSLQTTNSHLLNEVKLYKSKEEKAVRTYREYEDKYKHSEKEKHSINMERQSLLHEIQDLQHQCDMERRAADNLKSVCKELELQVIDYEGIIKQYEQKESDWTTIRNGYEETLKSKDRDVQNADKLLEAEMIARDADTNILNSLTQKLNTNKSDYIDEINGLRCQLEEAKKKLNKCFHQLSVAEKRGSKLDNEKTEMKQSLCNNKEYESQLKELCSKQAVELDHLREENRKIKDNWQEAMDKFELIFGEKVDLERVMELLQSSYCLEKYRFESMMGQQMKLIDYMHALIPDSTAKKKKCSRLFGSFKSKDCMNKTPVRAGGDLYTQVEAEKKKNAKLQEQIEKMRAENYQLASEVLKLKTGDTDAHEFLTGRSALSDPAVISSLSNSPTTHTLSKLTSSVSSSGLSKSAPGTPMAPAKPPRARMNHNIPHRFVSGYNTRATKCAVCLGNVPFVSQAKKCEECHIVCHMKCASQVPPTCGLLLEYIQNFTSCMRRIDSADTVNSSQTNPCEISSYLKIQRSGRNSWDQCWVKLDGNMLMIYNDEDDSSPIDSFDLYPTTNNEVVVHSAVTAAELPNTATSDLLYIMKVEEIPDNTCWPGKILYLMCMNFSDKQRWAAALEAVVKKRSNANKQTRLMHTVVLQLNDTFKIELNCCLILNKKFLLLGGEEGLFVSEIQNSSYSLYSTPVKICGVSSVYHMQSVSSLQLVVLLVGEDRALIAIKKKSLKNKHFHKLPNQSNPIPYDTLDKVIRCTVFDVGMWEECVYLCAGMIDRIVLMKYNHGLDKFCVRKEFTTIAEPCSCVCVADKFAIVGTDQFMCIDFENPSLKEYLDSKDPSFKCIYDNTSLPLNVVKISPQGAPLEFLLCYYEFGVYVDYRGRRSRSNNLRWSGVPLTFAYHDPYLFVTYFNFVQAINIPMNRSQIKGKQMSFVKVRPRYLGRAPGMGSAFFAYICQQRTEVLCLRGGNHDQVQQEDNWDTDVDPDDDALPGNQLCL